jgi:hypothetical protein
MEMTPSQIVDTIRYDLESVQLEDNSKYNLDKAIKTIPFGRNEDPSKSKYSAVDTQEVNFFPDSMASGFTARQQLGDSKFNGDSKYGWVGKSGAAPSVNYMSDENAKGFKTFTENNKTAFVINSSRFGFVKIPEVNYFDENKIIEPITEQSLKSLQTKENLEGLGDKIDGVTDEFGKNVSAKILDEGSFSFLELDTFCVEEYIFDNQNSQKISLLHLYIQQFYWGQSRVLLLFHHIRISFGLKTLLEKPFSTYEYTLLSS